MYLKSYIQHLTQLEQQLYQADEQLQNACSKEESSLMHTAIMSMREEIYKQRRVINTL